jgi:hypothetical protein
MREADALQVDGLPLEILSFNPGSCGLWGTPDAVYIESQLLEGNECRRDGRLQRRAALVKAFVDKEMMSQEDVDSFLMGNPSAVVRLDVPAGKTLGAAMQLIQPHIQMEYFPYQKELLNDAQLLVGVGPNQVGTFATGRRSAREAQLVEDNSGVRTTARRQKLARTIEGVVSKANQLICRYWQSPMIAKVVGVDAAVYWLRARPVEFEKVKEHLVSKVNVESMTPVSRDRRRQEMVDVLNVLSKFQGVNPWPILQSFLSNFDWANVMAILPQGAQQNIMDIAQFQQQQQSLLAQPKQLAEQRVANLSAIGPVVNALPAMAGPMQGGQ